MGYKKKESFLAKINVDETLGVGSFTSLAYRNPSEVKLPTPNVDETLGVGSFTSLGFL